MEWAASSHSQRVEHKRLVNNHRPRWKLYRRVLVQRLVHAKPSQGSRWSQRERHGSDCGDDGREQQRRRVSWKDRRSESRSRKRKEGQEPKVNSVKEEVQNGATLRGPNQEETEVDSRPWNPKNKRKMEIQETKKQEGPESKGMEHSSHFGDGCPEGKKSSKSAGSATAEAPMTMTEGSDGGREHSSRSRIWNASREPKT
jgi:hypothetical protein